MRRGLFEALVVLDTCLRRYDRRGRQLPSYNFSCVGPDSWGIADFTDGDLSSCGLRCRWVPCISTRKSKQGQLPKGIYGPWDIDSCRIKQQSPVNIYRRYIYNLQVFSRKARFYIYFKLFQIIGYCAKTMTYIIEGLKNIRLFN